ncbi:MAG: histidine phosphatase family protein [Bacteroidota bacterium]
MKKFRIFELPRGEVPCFSYTIVQVAFLLSALLFSGESYAQLEELKAHYQELEKKSKKQWVNLQFADETILPQKDLKNLQQIVLIRHGEPALKKEGWRTRKKAMKFLQAYDAAEVYEPAVDPFLLRPGDVDTIFTSTLNRSISTAAYLFDNDQASKSTPIFREFERKIFVFPNIILPLNWWLVSSRLLWFAGLNDNGIESFRDAKCRARVAVRLLEENAQRNGKTILVSHGLLNHFLSKFLKENGWTEVYDGGKGYLSQKMLVKLAPEE